MTGQNHKRRNNTPLFHFIAVVICARQTACLIDENVVEPTVSDHWSPDIMVNITCGTNHPSCPDICGFCTYSFPEQEMDCLAYLLKHICLETFRAAMNESNWCDWDHVSGFYSDLSHCTEVKSDCLVIPWPNPLVQEMFLDIHSEYFQDCPSEELSDPPPAIVFALVITPICLIPIMVSLVVFKTKNGDGSP